MNMCYPQIFYDTVYYITDWNSTTRKQLPEETSSEVKGAVPAAKGKLSLSYLIVHIQYLFLIR